MTVGDSAAQPTPALQHRPCPRGGPTARLCNGGRGRAEPNSAQPGACTAPWGSVPPFGTHGLSDTRGWWWWLVLPSLFCTPILFWFALQPAVAVLRPGRVLYPEFVLHHEVIVLHRRFLVLHPELPLQSGVVFSVPRVCFVLFVLHPRAVLHPEVVVLYPGFLLHSAVVVLQPQGVFCALGWFCTPGLLCAQVFVSPPGVFFLRSGCFSALVSVVCHSCFCLFCTPVSVMHPGFLATRFCFTPRVLFRMPMAPLSLLPHLTVAGSQCSRVHPFSQPRAEVGVPRPSPVRGARGC